MQKMPAGKFRKLKRCSAPNATFSILAIDHRTSLLKAMGQGGDQAGADPAPLVRFKDDVVRNLGEAADAILLDPEYGAAQTMAAGSLPPEKGLIVSVERSGYRGEPTLRENELLEGWSVEKMARLGADAAKLLVYYHPQAKNAAQVERYIAAVADECGRFELPLFLEAVTYSLDPGSDKVAGEERRRVVVETAERLSALGADVLKLQFPTDIRASEDRRTWAAACAEVTSASRCPWVLLSASVDYETFVEQVVIGCEQGSAGIAVGRAVWKEAVLAKSGSEREEFLSGIGRERMEELHSICQKLARPWTDYYSAPDIGDRWYENY